MTDDEYAIARDAWLNDTRRLRQGLPPRTEAMRDAIEPTLPSGDAPIDVRTLSESDYAAARAAFTKTKR